MRKILVMVVVVLVTAAVGNAAVNLLNNSSFESHADDGYGREMPTGFGLWTEGWNWNYIPNTEVVTLDARTGSASFQIDDSQGIGGAAVALTYTLGQLPVGYYHVGGWFKGDGTGGTVGVDMFAPDWSSWYWGGGTSLAGISADTWTYAGFDFQVTDPAVQFNFVVKGTAATPAFLVDDVIAVPEPVSLSLLALGALLLRRRK
ncbi:MAG: hypothetical protein A2Y10_05445 [Planctomycetes bacterium GWF2_41_51]|nr:MAG: hypothetical protein A2Y10_05445 [Planctomycetes bacterium GWF2_41_51]HBG26797.1 hypothetical protein [Phycisphaerales bacterium]